MLKHTINVPAKDETEGGQVNLWFKDGNVAYVDTYTDTSGGYSHNGVPLGKNEKYMRLVCKTNNNNTHDGWASGLLVRVSTGKLYMPESTTDPFKLVPISAGGTGYDDTNLQTQIDTLKSELQQVKASSGGGTQVAVQATPPSTTTGAMWWDTNTATMYVYDGAAWVPALPGGGLAVQSFQISTPLDFGSRNIHNFNFLDSTSGQKLSVSDFTETANTIGDTSYQIDQAAGSGDFKMFKVPSSGGPYLVEVDGVVYDADSGSGDRFTLGLYTCDSETGVTAKTDNSVPMTEIAVGYQTGGSSSTDRYGVSILQTSNVIANGKFFYLRINSIGGGSAGLVTAKVKVTNLSAG